MATNFALTLGLLWTPPSAAVNSGSSALQVQGSVTGQNVGRVDVPMATTTATIYPIPFGAVAVGKLFIIKNAMSSDIGVRFNAASADNFLIAPGGVIVYAANAGPGLTPLASASFITKGVPTTTESVEFWVMGD